MGRARADGADTRRRLLDAAGVLFAARGFRDTTTADICRSAGANAAAVNYHFHSKADLYAAAWRHEFERSMAEYPPDGGAPDGASAEERLRGHIRSLVKRFMDPASRDLDITHREMSDPTGLLAEVKKSMIEPLRLRHLAIVRKLLGPGAAAQEVRLCAMSTHAQCVMALMNERRRRLAARARRGACPPDLNIGGAAMAEHIARFSLAGIRAVRNNSLKRRRRK